MNERLREIKGISIKSIRLESALLELLFKWPSALAPHNSVRSYRQKNIKIIGQGECYLECDEWLETRVASQDSYLLRRVQQSSWKPSSHIVYFKSNKFSFSIHRQFNLSFGIFSIQISHSNFRMNELCVWLILAENLFILPGEARNDFVCK